MSNKKKTSKDDKLLYSKNMIYSTYYMLAYNIKELQYFDIDSIENIDGMSMIELLGAIFVKALEKMQEEGQDIYCTLPILSVYMGHKDVKSTEYYLKYTKVVRNKINIQMEKFNYDIFEKEGNFNA